MTDMAMKTILLIDDDKDVLAFLGDALRGAGHHIIPRSDAGSALGVLREGTRVDLVITDYQMPGLDALSFMSRLRESAPNVPVIVLTGHGNVELYLKVMSLGAFEYVNKPVRTGELNRIVQSALQGPATGPLASGENL